MVIKRWLLLLLCVNPSWRQLDARIIIIIIKGIYIAQVRKGHKCTSM